jgi:hypothetical protein
VIEIELPRSYPERLRIVQETLRARVVIAELARWRHGFGTGLLHVSERN